MNPDKPKVLGPEDEKDTGELTGEDTLPGVEDLENLTKDPEEGETGAIPEMKHDAPAEDAKKIERTTPPHEVQQAKKLDALTEKLMRTSDKPITKLEADSVLGSKENAWEKALTLLELFEAHKISDIEQRESIYHTINELITDQKGKSLLEAMSEANMPINELSREDKIKLFKEMDGIQAMAEQRRLWVAEDLHIGDEEEKGSLRIRRDK